MNVNCTICLVSPIRKLPDIDLFKFFMVAFRVRSKYAEGDYRV